jgi:sugar O-acyltransferase (sialic acid O-acetyltransferase NeuD family)
VNEIAIYGAGGFGRETLEMIHQMNKSGNSRWRPIGFFDDRIKKGTFVEGLPVLGDSTELNASANALAVVVTVADPLIRHSICSKIRKPNITFPPLVHPSANLGSASNKIHEGVIITAGVILTTNVVVEEFTIINLLSTIGHDVTIGAYSSIMPACHVSGNVKIGPRAFLGTAACILQNLSIGENAVVGAGSVVTRSVDPSTTVYGAPAKPKVNV